MRILRAPLLIVIALLLGLGLAAPASADTDAAIAALSSANLYVDPSAGATLDQASARAALNSSVKIAVLPDDAGDASSLAVTIGSSLPGDITVGVFVGHTFSAGSNRLCAGQAASYAKKSVTDNQSQLRSDNDLTATITEFAAKVRAASSCKSGSSDTQTGSSTSGWTIIALLGVLGAAAVGGLTWRRRRRDRVALADARANIQPYFDRLASDVGSLQPGDDATARQALADASERFNSGGSQLASARTVAQLTGARRSILEGLQATQTARRALGLDPGPDLPPIVESAAPQLTEAQQITAGGRTVQGYPAYTPGAPYYFGGGGGYAGGWYSTPFWESLLIAEALTPGWGMGGFGGGWGGGGYGSGYDSGFEAGRDSTQQGGDWGGGGGDWGGGGGDWGAGGGGGDWGGGGNDSGGSW